MLNKVLHGDCLELMKDIPDGSVDLIVIDPPYNIKKAKWDKWQTISAYVDFMGKAFTQCERVLKKNGSFYFFHNDFMQIVELQCWLNENSSFIFKQFIVWNKMFSGASNKGFLQGFREPEGLRNYQKMAEYCLYYTFQDETGLTTVMLDTNNFSTLRQYFKDLQGYIGLPKSKILERVGGKADHCFRWGSSQWDMPTAETYQELIDVFNIDQWDGFRDYKSCGADYGGLRADYERLRYTFNNQKTHHSVWNYEIAPKQGHVTPKPVELIENIILHSSNQGDVVLDCFAGSGTTAIACIKTDRNYILMEQEKKYIDIINKRIDEETAQGRLF
jgi:site-specific DNA-methyltransferase (adenine-specific)